MAVGSSFKQKCPSCEAMVAIKDPSLVGKKVECSKCKYRFVVESPIDQDKAAVKKAQADEGETNGKNGNGARAKNGPAAKPDAKKRFKDEDLEERDAKKPAKAGAAAKKGRDADEAPRKGKKPVVDDDEDDDEDAPKSGAPLKLILGLGLALVGVSVLAVAAWLILSGGGGNTAPRAPGGPMPGPGPAVAENPTPKVEPVKDDKKDIVTPTAAAASAGPEQTNLLPNDTEHVLHVFMKDLFESGGALRDAVFQTGGSLASVNFKKRLGFDVLDVADIVRGEKYTGPAWSMAVLFLNQPADEKAVSAALGLKKAEPIKNQVYYEATKPNPTFDRLAGFTFGVPHKLRLAAARGERKLFVHFHNPQTMVVGDQEPITALLRNEGHFPELTRRPAPPAAPPSSNPGPSSPEPGMAMPGSPMPMPGSPMPTMPPGSPMPTTPPGSPMPMPGSPIPTMPPGSPMPTTPPGQPMPTTPPGSPMPMPTTPPGSPMPMPGSPMPMPGSPTPPGMTPSGMAPPGMAPPGMAPPGMAPPGMAPPGMTPPGMTPPGGAPGGNTAAPPPAPVNPRDLMYLTIRPNLKAALDRLERLPDGAKDRVLIASVTDLQAARIAPGGAEWRNQIVRIPRELWDITYLLQERHPSLSLLATALVQKDTRVFELRNDLTCVREADAKEHYKHLLHQGAPQVARYFDKLFDHKVQLPKEEAPPEINPNGPPGPGGFPQPGFGPIPGSPPGMPRPMPPGGGGQTFVPPGSPMPGYGQPGFGPPGFGPPGTKPAEPAKKEKEEVVASQITLTRNDRTIEFTLDLVLDRATYDRLLQVAALAAGMLRTEIDLSSRLLHAELAQAVKQTAEKGLSAAEPPLPPGLFPPGAFQPLEAGNRRSAYEPQNRISWMAALLPQLGHEAVYNRLSFRHGWREPNNWLAGQAVIPQFLDPRYPAATRQVTVSGVPTEFGATHFVAIAGVGLDAPTYSRDDPAFVAKRGIFSYDKSATLKDVQQGRGLANTIALIQVPHDGTAGVTPWVAGGGATIRGVPEKNSIAPFVLSTDKFGKVMQHDGKRGTYAMMADGSVRFINQNVSDDVFKAMCTVGGGAPEDFDALKNKYTTPVKFPKEEIVPDEPFIRAPSAPKGPAGGDTGNWITYKAPDGSFTASFPRQPEMKDINLPGVGKVNVHLVELPSKSSFGVSLLALPPGAADQAKTPEGLRKFAQLGTALVPGLKFTSEKTITHSGHTGLEFTVEANVAPLGKITSKSRVFVIGARLLSVDAGGIGGIPPEADRFFNSLVIHGNAGGTPPAKGGPAPPR